MYRNLPLIAFINGLLVLVNIYLLISTQNNGNPTIIERGVITKSEVPEKTDLKCYQSHTTLVKETTSEQRKKQQQHTSTTVQNLHEIKHEVRISISEQPSLPQRLGMYNSGNEKPKYKRKTSYRDLEPGYKVPLLKKANEINCKALLAGDRDEISKAKDMANQREYTKIPIYEETYLEWTKNCSLFKTSRGYIDVPLSEEEKDFPIAFSISMFTDVEQMERLLRAVYQPQNLYCVHVDIKSSLLIHETVRAIVNCFDNVFITTQNAKVKWGDISVLLPHLSCMTDLVNNYEGKWQYFIDLAGQEFPLRTNYEIVQILKIFNGSNDITASHKRMEQDRIRFQWAYRWSRTYQQTIVYNTFREKDPPPFNLTVLKGEIHGLFSRHFVNFIVNSAPARQFLEWCWDTSHASEHYWNTLNYNRQLNAPGGYYGDFEEIENYSLEPVTRAKHWQDENYAPRECQGKLVRGICVYGIGDISWLGNRKEIIANKFHLTFEYIALDCLEERHRNRTAIYVGSVAHDFDTEYYKNLPTVKYSYKNGL